MSKELNERIMSEKKRVHQLKNRNYFLEDPNGNSCGGKFNN